MTGFSADWLAAREAADAAARSRALAGRLPRPVCAVLDLGAGTGANLRWLAPLLGRGQRWCLMDADAGLLGEAAARTRDWAGRNGFDCELRGDGFALTGPGFDCSVASRVLDLNAKLDELVLPDGCLLTASALLDLVSRDWLEALVERIAASRASVLFALSYDGEIAIEPQAEDDARIAALVNRHQLTDKGFGPALGPSAWQAAAGLLEEAAWRVTSAATPWHIEGPNAALLEPLITGWSGAAAAMAPAEAPVIEAWRDRRLAEAGRAALAVTVGHRDLLALPPAGPAEDSGQTPD